METGRVGAWGGRIGRRAVLAGAVGAAGAWVSGVSSSVAAAELLEGTLITDLGEIIYDLALTPDGQSVVAATLSNNAYVVQLSDGSTTGKLRGHTDEVNGVAVSPDGTLIATASDDYTVRLWRRDDLSARVLRGHRADVYGVAFSPDGATLVSGGDDNVRFWRVADGMVTRQLAVDARRVAFTPDGATLIVAGDDALSFWRVADGARLRSVTGERCVAVSPDGQLCASQGPNDYAVELWRVADGANVRTFKGHRDSVDALAFTPDGQVLVTASDDDSVRAWRVGDGRLLYAGIDDYILGYGGVVVLPDGKTVITGGGEIYRYMLP